jgi:hypothetical protein
VVADASLAECVKVAIVKYDTLMALSPDVRRERYRETISDMVSQALAELRPYGVPSAVQGRVEWKPDGLRLPVQRHARGVAHELDYLEHLQGWHAAFHERNVQVDLDCDGESPALPAGVGAPRN